MFRWSTFCRDRHPFGQSLSLMNCPRKRWRWWLMRILFDYHCKRLYYHEEIFIDCIIYWIYYWYRINKNHWLFFYRMPFRIYLMYITYHIYDFESLILWRYSRFLWSWAIWGVEYGLGSCWLTFVRDRHPHRVEPVPECYLPECYVPECSSCSSSLT